MRSTLSKFFYAVFIIFLILALLSLAAFVIGLFTIPDIPAMCQQEVTDGIYPGSVEDCLEDAYKAQAFMSAYLVFSFITGVISAGSYLISRALNRA